MKTKSLSAIFVLTLLVAFVAGCSGSGTPTETVSGSQSGPRPLNLTIYVDLSNRLVQTPDATAKKYEQKNRDLAIVDLLAEAFVRHSRDTFQYIHSRDIFEVTVYPVPNGNGMDGLLGQLKTDCTAFGKNFAARKQRLLTMKDSIHQTLEQIYDRTIRQQDWLGADIWGFFSYGAARERCVREGYRNVLVVITDGYIYHVNNAVAEGMAFSYISGNTLSRPAASLIVREKGLENLEVMFMELEHNSKHPEYRDRQHNVICKWLREMNVKRYKTVDTDNPGNLDAYISNFLAE